MVSRVSNSIPGKRECDVGKETSLDRVELRAVAGIVGHPDFNPEVVDQGLQVVLEKVLRRLNRFPPAVAKQEDGTWRLG